MKIIPKTKKDFAWVDFTAKDIREFTKKILKEMDLDAEAIKKIPKEKRTFENTVFAIDQIGESTSEDSPIAFLQFVSTDKSVREASKEFQEKCGKKGIDILANKDLYRAFSEYKPKNLSIAETRLYKDWENAFKDQGFDLPKKAQRELKEIRKKETNLGIKFSNNIASYKDQILCTKEELAGLPETFVNNLQKDKKTGKYVVTLAYPELQPFMRFAKSAKKRQELADKASQKGGKENLKILAELLKLRKREAQILGYKNYVDFAVKENIASKGETIKSFLTSTIEKLQPEVKKEFKMVEKYAGEKMNYYNFGFFAGKMKDEKFGFDPNQVKEYFEIGNVVEKMFSIFGGLFGVSFKENKSIKLWHKEAQIFDIIENRKVVAHLCFDLYPRENKYSHMACWPLVPGKNSKFKKGDFLAPVHAIVGNFPRGTKTNPSLLSIDEVETMFHEFGHAMHGSLSRALFASQSSLLVVFDFVEMPSQLFENWVRNKENLKFISKHYKTGKKIDDNLLSKVVKSFEFMKAHEHYGTFVCALQDYDMHSDKYKSDLLKLDKDFRKKYYNYPTSPKSLFPAAWGHMIGYAAKYYAYMWALVYSYDVFSRFKKEGVLNKEVGMDLRRKILEKGDSEDALKLMTDFLGRKPNNKAFLEALK